MSLKPLLLSEKLNIYMLGLVCFYLELVLSSINLILITYGVIPEITFNILRVIKFTMCIFLFVGIIFNHLKLNLVSMKKEIFFISTFFFYILISLLFRNVDLLKSFIIKDAILVGKMGFMFIIGLCLLKTSYLRKSVIYIYWMLALIISMFIDFPNFRMWYGLEGMNNSWWWSYLVWGNSFAIISLLTFVAQNTLVRKLIVFLISNIMLVYISSRSAIICFNLSIFLFLALKENYRRTFLYLISLLVLTFCTVKFFSLENYFPNRTRVFFNFESDQSGSLRIQQFIHGVKDIKENIFSGSYMGQLKFNRDTPSRGNYIHSYLSIWRQFGLIPFIMILVMIGFILKTLKSNNTSSEFFVLSTFILINCIFFKSYTYPYLFLVLGWAVSIKYYKLKTG